jgi:hypothetical protein
MSLSTTERALCNSLVGGFASLISPIIAAKGAIQAHKRNLRNTLRDMVFSPDVSNINDEINNINNDLSGLYPGSTTDDMSKLKQFLDNCSYMSGLNPISALLGTGLSIFDSIYDALEISTIGEMGAASIASLINSLLNGFGIPGGANISDLLKKADKLIECLASVCGTSDASYIVIAAEYAGTLDDLYSDLNVVSDPLDPNYGNFDYQAVYDDVGLNAQEVIQVNTAIVGAELMKTNASNAIDNSVNAAKTLMKTGFFS